MIFSRPQVLKAMKACALLCLQLVLLLLQTYQGALDMLENVYIKTGGTDKCFGSGDAGGHGSGESIELRQGEPSQPCLRDAMPHRQQLQAAATDLASLLCLRLST